jgi:ABC-type multidrug transport system fused ATPase/permease subunit
MKKTIYSVLKLLKPAERKTFWLQVTGDVMISLADIVFLTFLVMMISNFAGRETILKTYMPTGAWIEKPLLLPGIFILIYAIKNLIALRLQKNQYDFIYNVAARLSAGNLDAYLHSDYKNYVETDSSVHIRKISQQPVEFAHYVVRGIQQVISQTVLVVIATAVLVLYKPVIFLLLLAALLPPFILCFYFLKKKENNIRHDIKLFSERSLQYLKEALAGFIENKIYAKNRFFSNRYNKYQQKLNDVLSARQFLQGSSSRLVEIFALTGLFGILFIRQEFSFAISAATIGAFMASAYKIIPGIVKIMNNMAQVKAYAFTIESGQTGKPVKSIEQERSRIQKIEVKNVSFSFGETMLLKNISFILQKGDIAGISSFSGKGKTTLVNLLLGFLHPAAGEIKVNGRHISENKEHYWSRISYVKQQAFLINDSTAKNISLSDEEPDDARYASVVETAGIVSYNSIHSIRENGRNISGGQGQRVALARALYKDFDLLVLDEPFSEMDQDSEIEMLRKLKEITSDGKMVLLITHNKQALRFCNKIISLDE